MADTSKKQPSHATQFARSRGCTAQIVCDGRTLTPNRFDKGTCLKCEQAALRRGKVPPLRGENTALPLTLRRKAVEDQLDDAFGLLGDES